MAPWQGSAPDQTYVRTDGTRSGNAVWANAEAAGIDIVSGDHDTHDEDLASAINSLLKRDGGNTISADINAGTKRLTNLGAGTAIDHTVNLGQVQNGELMFGIDTGAANAYAITLNPALTGFAGGLTVRFKAINANTGAATLNINELGAKPIKKNGAEDPIAGDIPADTIIEVAYDSAASAFQMIGGRAALMEQGRHAIWIPAAAFRPRMTDGCAALISVQLASGQPDLHALDFDKDTTEYAQVWWKPPKSWDEGTVTMKPVWTHSSTATTYDAVWGLAGVAISNDDTIAASYGTRAQSTDTGGTGNDMYIGPETTAITLGGTPADGDLVSLQISRVATAMADTLDADARLLGIELLITLDAGNDS